ncbi:hypothetical protein GUJ93_ZPchr0013g34069 [Zizania palustris]|uniref:Uncharacterized protein n=1 Tax=Zizania palustris TaxID=103762 RepID=A0A8J5WXP6_ZIZPA|nr:hypothetical protein GUJ93_ZPchr0013g34069 [Zizania palustris]
MAMFYVRLMGLGFLGVCVEEVVWDARAKMLRQSSSRNYRSKVKHSYEKKAYNENETNEPHKDDQNEGEMIRLGRKDLPTKMEADSSTLDERIEDEENEEMEQEMKHDENDEDPIDEPDLDKDDDLPENGEHSAGKDEGSEDVGVFEDEEPKGTVSGGSREDLSWSTRAASNSTAVLNNQIQLFTDLTSASPPNGTVALASTDAEKATSVDRDHDGNTGTSSTLVNNKVEEGDTDKDTDLRQKIMNKAISEDEVLLE